MRGRYIRENKSSRCPGSHIAFDTETVPYQSNDSSRVVQAMRCVCAVYWRMEKGRVRCRREYVGYSGKAFWEWVAERLSEHRSTWIWAHNVAFDLSITRFWELWDKGDFVPKFKVLDDPPVIIKGKLFGKTVVILDTFNWFRTSVKKLGEWQHLPKFEQPAVDADIRKWVAYCWRDTEIVEATVNSLVGMVKELDLGVLRQTAPAQAFRHWRHMKSRPNVLIPDHKEESQLARDGYYAGRAELFFRGPVAGPIHVVDVNGMYASSFIESKQPIRLLDYSDKLSVQDVQQYAADCSCAATVELDTHKPFPYREKWVGTVWCTGRFVTTLVGCELTDAISCGVVKKVLRAAHYEMGHVGKAFCEYWWSQRLQWRSEGKLVLEAFAKGMPCYLYGKFGQTLSEWVPDGEYQTQQRFSSYIYYDYDERTVYKGRVIAGVAEYDKSSPADSGGAGGFGYDRFLHHTGSRKETEWSFPAISAWVTASARAIMDEYRRIAGVRNVYYQCYDCLHVNSEGYTRLWDAGLIQPEVCGKLKRKCTLDSAEYYAINLLREDGVMKAAGLPSLHREVNPGEFRATTFERMSSLLSRRPDGTVIVAQMRWSPDYRYTQSRVDPDGWCRPWHKG